MLWMKLLPKDSQVQVELKASAKEKKLINQVCWMKFDASLELLWDISCLRLAAERGLRPLDVVKSRNCSPTNAAYKEYTGEDNDA